MKECYDASVLRGFSAALLINAGLAAERANVVAEILLEGDLLGHSTHGLQLLAPYLADLENGRMQASGEPAVIADFPAAVTWDGRRLPGPWLTVSALRLALARAKINGTCSVVIRRSHHIGCLAAYLRRITDEGMLVLLSCSDPTVRGVAPHGGVGTVFTPNPMAAAWPTDGEPVIMDVSMSITTMGLVRRYQAEGRRLPGKWIVAADGEVTDDPAKFFSSPPGALLPMGGTDHGHKGYSLGLLIEALTGGLAGHGRADPSEGWSANVYVQVMDPALFAGKEAFIRQTSHVADACRATPPRQGFDRVRLPGESGLQRRKFQLENGVDLYPGIMPSLEPWAKKLNVTLPTPLPSAGAAPRMG